MDITALVQLYIAFLVVITIHELGHFPKRIKFKLGLIPRAAAMQARFRYGGLIANILLFWVISIKDPSSIFVQYIGLLAWVHFIVYAIFGSFLKESKISNVNIKFHIFDDIPNRLWYIFVPLAAVAFIMFKDYYLPILQGIF